ncbi:MAG: S41 family peptidase [Phycisphaerales bacterium]|nr:S41 family peptidase [Phycisphaerales bacterium]
MKRRPLLIAALAAVTALPFAVRGDDAITVVDWAEQVWQAAEEHQDSTRTFSLLRQIPDEHDHLGVRRLHTSVARWIDHSEAAELVRQESYDTALAELATAIGEDDLREALRAAIELQDLSGDDAAVREKPDVANLIQQAAANAREAEAEGRVLEALDWFRRLDLLYETERSYHEDLLRIAERVALVSFYAPQRLHDLRNEFALKNDEDPLPEYNAGGESWSDKVQEITERMLFDAADAAEQAHIDHIRYGELALGGFEAVKTLLTTADLDEAFPGLRNETDRTRLLRFIDAHIEQLRGDPKLSGYQFRKTVRALVEENRDTVALPKEVIYREFGNGVMSRLDTYSTVIWPDEMAFFNRSMTGEFVGVGIQIQLDTARQLKVVTPIEGTPAQRAGVKRGDLIRMIDGESTVGISLTQAVERITGERGTQVTLTVEREGSDELIPLTIARDIIPLYSVKGWKRTGKGETDWDYFVDPLNHIGYIRLTSFTDDTVDELDRAVATMRAQGLSGLILDLRFNPGGLLSAATRISNRFVASGLLVSTEDKSGRMTWHADASPHRASLGSIPTVVLINEGSASASEIVAGCLQDHNRALIVGERSYGKGSVQQVMSLRGGRAALKLTMQQYRLPRGRLIHRHDGDTTWGVEPDIKVPMTSDQLITALELRQDADLLPLDEDETLQEAAEGADEELSLEQQEPELPPDPTRLLTEGLDPQLETALVLLQTRILAQDPSVAQAMLDR